MMRWSEKVPSLVIGGIWAQLALQNDFGWAAFLIPLFVYAIVLGVVQTYEERSNHI